ncbi:hypothetical protein LNQ52_17995 [Klebsiella pneumoniae subsp. pneumoniae]|nr:hypothetical protein [Klebsiella pneumoniae subsp. pneumoniae]
MVKKQVVRERRLKKPSPGDICTGGDVRYVDFSSGQQNIESEKHLISDVNDALFAKGMIMDTNNPLSQPVPITEQEVSLIFDS